MGWSCLRSNNRYGLRRDPAAYAPAVYAPAFHAAVDADPSSAQFSSSHILSTDGHAMPSIEQPHQEPTELCIPSQHIEGLRARYLSTKVVAPPRRFTYERWSDVQAARHWTLS
jgi:hypothetical protein